MWEYRETQTEDVQSKVKDEDLALERTLQVTCEEMECCWNRGKPWVVVQEQQMLPSNSKEKACLEEQVGALERDFGIEIIDL